MHHFLKTRGYMPPGGSTYIDLGCSYGWFVAKLQEYGFTTSGVERDPIAASIGKLLYKLSDSQIHQSDCVRFLHEVTKKYDVVSCFSVLHHFVLGNGRVSAVEFIRLIDSITRRVLFFDTGQSTEAWLKDDLQGWTPDHIENWLRQNTSFKEIVRLGSDEDAVPPFQDNYGRMLFACVK
jgi:hypothetical protein